MVNKPIVGVAALISVLAAGGVYYLRSRNPPIPAAPAGAVSTVPAADESAIAHPLPAAGNATSSAPLPALADSDMPLRAALAQLGSADAVKDYLTPQDVIRKMVVTIDNLPRQKVAVEKRPTNPIAGSFAAAGDELHATLDQRNFERYKPMVAAIKHVAMRLVMRSGLRASGEVPALRGRRRPPRLRSSRARPRTGNDRP